MASTSQNPFSFSVEDPDFKAFMPQISAEILESPWTDFNLHDPGVTTLEALLFAFEDLAYKYELPLPDLMQGKEFNPFSAWLNDLLGSAYAVTEWDFRVLLANQPDVLNAAVIPAPGSVTQGLYNLLKVAIAAAPSPPPDLRQLELVLLRRRPLGTYFYRPSGRPSFIQERLVSIDFQIQLTWKEEGEPSQHQQFLKQTLANFLLPVLHLRPSQATLQIPTFTSTERDSETQDPQEQSFSAPGFRKVLTIAQLYHLIQELDCVALVSSIEIKLADGPAPFTPNDLHFPQYTFTQLGTLKVNEKEVEEQPEKRKLPAFPHPSSVPKGSWKNTGAFYSLQRSFPPIYDLGSHLTYGPDGNASLSANFRTFLSFFDQVRANQTAQLGKFYDLFSPTALEAKLSTHSLKSPPDSFYDDLPIPSPAPAPTAMSLLFQQRRLDYLLALHGWDLTDKIPKEYGEKEILRIKTEFLHLVHTGHEEKQEEESKGKSTSLNPLFRSVSLILLGEKIRILLSQEVVAVQIVEHWLFQAVNNAHRQLNFEISIFLFVPFPVPDRLRDCTQQLLNDLVPAHLVWHVHFKPEDSQETLTDLLREAVPPHPIFYLDEPLTPLQERAMIYLLSEWIYPESI